jgi:hypothetical protein
MTTSIRTPRHWIGHWLMLVAAIHTVFGLVVFRTDLYAMASQGFFNTVGADPRRAAVAFFMLFGFLLAMLAQAVTALENKGPSASLPLPAHAVATAGTTTLWPIPAKAGVSAPRATRDAWWRRRHT